MLVEACDSFMRFQKIKYKLQFLIVFKKVSLMCHKCKFKMVKIVHMDQKVSSSVKE